MDGGRVAWVVGAYLAGTFPSTYLVARIMGAAAVFAGATSLQSEGDAHILLSKHAGGKWAALAAFLDVAKGLAYGLAGEHLGHLPPAWLASVGVLVVVGHSFPFYARAMAGRGLSAAAGVLLALLPVAMMVAGVIILIGIRIGSTGPASTIGFALAPAVAAIQGKPGALVAMAGAIVLVILLRRAVGVGRVAARVGWRRALVRRLLFDADQPRELAGRHEPDRTPEPAGGEERAPARRDDEPAGPD